MSAAAGVFVAAAGIIMQRTALVALLPSALGLTGTYPTSPIAGSLVDKRESCFWVTVSDDSLYNWVRPRRGWGAQRR